MARYQEIALSLEAAIGQTYQPGQYLPPEQHLASEYRVNRHTLRRAIDELVSKGWLMRQQGKGVLVLNQPVRYPLHSGAKFSDNVANIGASPTTRLLAKQQVLASAEVSRALELAPGTKIWRLKTLRFIDEVAVSVVLHHFVPSSHDNILRQYRSGSVHHFLAQQGALALQRQRTLISAQMATEDECLCLQMPCSAPLLRLFTTNVDDKKKPFECSIALIRAEFVELTMEH
ncbi:phosphonate metabolism transcriptional regulator PhnF [Motilimonas pumila]|uniref:Phosphonate metabolism transcriptional regulator PhnF n=1 Tax=Motilimonas pumila TaxID=2303987 RepID=A0A418YES6_9GAMM|nr:phosphonate metabolism transcriptional regulator PhnF [Motilimonas pumila]RJG47679.1 phosphonate metabolism transcriptional regulator PhnF [Motilimonas pumila]